MKKFILFLFLATMISTSAWAQEGTDEFADPTLQNDTTPPPAGFETSDSGNLQATPIPETNLSKPQVAEPEPQAQSQPVVFDERLAENEQDGDVVMEKPVDVTKSYKERRGRHGILFSLDYEKYYPKEYLSLFDDVKIDKFLGSSEPLDLIGLELGYKMNFQLGSLAILGNYAQGSKANTNYTVGTTRERNLAVSRYGLSFNLALDNIMQEPWIVPYGQVGVHQFQVIEDDLGEAEAIETTTQISFNYKFGLLFQLNWIEKSIDPNTQSDGLRSSGLQNTFLDISATSYMASSDTYSSNNPNDGGDPDMSSGLQLGVGLKMEF